MELLSKFREVDETKIESLNYSGSKRDKQNQNTLTLINNIEDDITMQGVNKHTRYSPYLQFTDNINDLKRKFFVIPISIMFLKTSLNFVYLQTVVKKKCKSDIYKV